MTTDLTPAQRARARELSWLLAATDRHDLWQEADGTSVMTAMEYFGSGETIGEFTEECRIAEEAGLIYARPLTVGTGAAWELTEAGRAGHELNKERPA